MESDEMDAADTKGLRIVVILHRRRVWILGQRCHHSAAGSLPRRHQGLRRARRRPFPPGQPSALARVVPLVAAGGTRTCRRTSWKDLRIWFEPGYGTQP